MNGNPSAPQVLVDGVDVRDLDPAILWTRIGLVPQRPYLFTGTVASNLRYGDPVASGIYVIYYLNRDKAHTAKLAVVR